MALRLGDEAPKFYSRDPRKAPSIFMNGWVMVGGFFFLTPRILRQFVRPNSEPVAKINDEFKKRNVKVLAISVDPTGFT